MARHMKAASPRRAGGRTSSRKASPATDKTTPADAPALDEVHHGYAPDAASVAPDGSDAEAPLGLRDTIAYVIEEAKVAARAEVALAQAKAQVAGKAAARAGIWLGTAIVAAVAAALALLYAMIALLAPYVGEALAALLVAAIWLLLALVGFLRGRAVVSHALRMLGR